MGNSIGASSIGALMIMLAAACGTGVDSDPGSSGDSGSDASVTPHGSSNACPEVDGPRHDYATPDELTQLMIGRWVHCAGPPPFVLDGSAGVEFTADGRYYQLVEDGGDKLVRGTGFSAEGKWDVSGTPDGNFVRLWFIPNAYFSDTPQFEDGPRRLAFLVPSDPEFAVYQLIP